MDPGGLADGLAIEQEFDSISRAFGKLPKPHRDGGGFEGPTKVGDPEKDDDAVNKRTLAEAVDAIKGAGGDAVLDVRWLTTRSPMRTGYAAGDGQTLSRALYPDALAAIQAGLVPVCTDAEWLADPAKRGCYTLGDGSATFRVPDYNGMQPGSYGPVYLGGGSAASGNILRDRMQTLIGKVFGYTATTYTSRSFSNAEGVFGVTGDGTTPYSPAAQAGAINGGALTFNSSNVARSGDTTRPITAEGCLAIKLFGAVQNAGSADAAALATAVAAIASRVSVVEGKVATLEQRKSTCLVNVTGTGAPHETVVTQLPANIAVNSRYVLLNPFGINTPVECLVEILLNGIWADPKFGGNAGTGSSSYGVAATYAQGVGIVVQTGRTGVCVDSAMAGGGHGVTGITASAPCRVFVRKLEA